MLVVEDTLAVVGCESVALGAATGWMVATAGTVDCWTCCSPDSTLLQSAWLIVSTTAPAGSVQR